MARDSGAALLFQAAETLELLVVLALLEPVNADLPDGLFVRVVMALATVLGFAEGVAEMFRTGEAVTLELLEPAIAPGRRDLVDRRLSAMRLAAEDISGIHGRYLL